MLEYFGDPQKQKKSTGWVLIFPACLGQSTGWLETHPKYPLVNQHSHGKWLIYRWFTY